MKTSKFSESQIVSILKQQWRATTSCLSLRFWRAL